MPQASRLHRVFDKKKSVQDKTEFLFPPSVGNQDNLPMGKTFGRVSPLSENLAVYLGDHFY